MSEEQEKPIVTPEAQAAESARREASRKAMVAIRADERGIKFSNYDELWRFAICVAESGLAPKGVDRPQSIIVAIQLGLEIGLQPMGALQNIAVINGRPSIYGDAALALVRSSGLLEDFDEWYEIGGKEVLTARGDPRTPTAKEVQDESCVCMVRSKRHGQKRAMVTSFSVADAKAAALWTKKGPWSEYPARMLKFRARGFNLRDNFGDVLKGLRTAEEVQDFPPEGAVRVSSTDSASRIRQLIHGDEKEINGNGGNHGATAPSEPPQPQPGSEPARANQSAAETSPPHTQAPVDSTPEREPGVEDDEVETRMRKDDSAASILEALKAAKTVSDCAVLKNRLAGAENELGVMPSVGAAIRRREQELAFPAGQSTTTAPAARKRTV